AIADLVDDGEVERADAARAGHPHRRVRLLDRPRPEVDVGQLIVPTVPREELARLPGLAREREGLAVALAVLHPRGTVGQVHVHRAAERQTRDEPAAADA